MKIKLTKIVFIILIVIFVLIFCGKVSLAGEKLNTDTYKENLKYSDAKDIFDKSKPILTLLRNIAAIASILTLTIIGIRYMVGSVEQKAEYKQTMLPVITGCSFIIGLAGWLTLIQSIF